MKPVQVQVDYPLEIQPDGDGGTGYELAYTRDGDGGTGCGDRLGDNWDKDVLYDWDGDGWGGGHEHHNQYKCT